MILKKKDHSWIVVSDEFADPLANLPGRIPKSTSTQYVPKLQEDDNQAVSDPKINKKYNREQAVNYAIKYAGFPTNEDKIGKYNKKYKDYTFMGGDCTNYVSQVLGDKDEGGGLPMTKDWFCHKGSCSKSWIHTESFLNFLKKSGYGQFLKVGLFNEVTEPSPEFPNGAINELQPGDLIGYEENNDVVHFAVVIGKDNQGYPIVNSHSANRHRVPWDLGWDKSTKFWLIHIKDY